MGSITRFSSPFSLKVVVCGHCHVTLPQTMKETLTCLMMAAQDHVGGDRVAVEYTTHPRDLLPRQYSPPSPSPSVQPAIFFPVSTARHLLPRQYSPPSSSPSVQPAISFPVSTARHLLPRQYSPPSPSPSVQPAIFFPVSTARYLLTRQYSPPSSSPSVQPAIFFPVSTAQGTTRR